MVSIKRDEKMREEIIHLCNETDQPNIRIKCTGEWTTPEWGAEVSEDDEIFVADNGVVYTHYEKLVTCPRCLGGIS